MGEIKKVENRLAYIRGVMCIREAVNFGEGIVLAPEDTVDAFPRTLQTPHHTTAVASAETRIAGVGGSGGDARTLLGVLLNPINAVVMGMEVVQMPQLSVICFRK